MGIPYPRAHLWFNPGQRERSQSRRVIRAQALIERPWISVPENSTV